MLILRYRCAWGLGFALSGAAVAAAQGYPQQDGYEQQQYPQQQYPQQQYQQQYPQQQQYQQQQYPQQMPPSGDQQPPPGYFPTPDAQGAYGYQQQYDPSAGYPAQPGPGVESGVPEQPQVSSVKGAFQLGAGITLLEHSGLSLKQSDPEIAVPNTATMVPAMASAALQPTCCGQDPHPMFLELGYGLSDAMLLGAELLFSSHSESLGDVPFKLSDFSFGFAPKFDYQLAPSSRWNPFVGGLLSVIVHDKSSWNLEDSQVLFGAAARFGLRYFALDQLSIDPAAQLGVRFGSGTQKDSNSLSSIDYSLSGFNFAVSIGLSLWIK